MRRPERTPLNGARTPELTAVIDRQHVDDLVDAYVSWREACAVVSAAYDDWKCAPREHQSLAFSEYVTALDREEEAAALYRRTVERVTAMTPA